MTLQEYIQNKQEEFDKMMNHIRWNKNVSERQEIKDFISQALTDQAKLLVDEIQTMIADEIRTAQKENKPTSRLTSLSVRIDEKFNI